MAHIARDCSTEVFEYYIIIGWIRIIAGIAGTVAGRCKNNGQKEVSANISSQYTKLDIFDTFYFSVKHLVKESRP